MKTLCEKCEEIYLEEGEICPMCGTEDSPIQIIYFDEGEHIPKSVIGKILRSKNYNMSVPGERPITLNSFNYIQLRDKQIKFFRKPSDTIASVFWRFETKEKAKEIFDDMMNNFVGVNYSQKNLTEQVEKYENLCNNIIKKVDESHPQLRQFTLDTIRKMCENAQN